jgi:UDP-4-amino-4,6-dideoxy-N-acetyl-beta-L-altrosamine transaminase
MDTQANLFSIPYGRQYITEEDLAAVHEALQGDFLTQGPAIAAFEEAFARYVGSKYAIALSNGTAALHLSALALGVKPGSKVITTPITFAASANCVLYCGGEVVFADIDPATGLLDIHAVQRLLEAAPRGTYSGIIPVDFAGNPVNLEAFRTLADAHGLWMIEDACHAPGGSFIDSKGIEQRCGNGAYADLAIFSFHPVKHIATGEGGMITTNSKELYDRIMVLRTHGITRDPAMMHEHHGGWYHEMQELGYNYRITDFQCALGSSQLKRADAGMQRRREIAARYDAAFKDTPLKTLSNTAESRHAYHLYVVLSDRRRALYDFLREKGIYSQVHYIPCHTHPYYRSLGHRVGDYPLSEAYYSRCLSLPMFPSMSDEEQEYVIQTVHSFFA